MSLRELLEAALRAGVFTPAQHVRLFEALLRAISFPTVAADRQRLQAACKRWDAGDRETAKQMVGFTRGGAAGAPGLGIAKCSLSTSG